MHLKKILLIMIILLAFLGIIYSASHFFTWNQENAQIKEELQEIESIVNVKEIPVNLEDEQTVNPPSESTSDYWEYINLPLIEVDFTNLSLKNSDTVAFLKVNGTNINYPVVQTNDNDFYLTHSFNKDKNNGGWVFMDYRNSLDKLDDNTIIYAHGRNNQTMFGSLKNIFQNSWYENTQNYVVYLATSTKTMLWQVFSVYQIPTENYYLTSNFATKDDYQKFIDVITARSKYDFKANVDVNDKILTLSTCYDNTKKIVLHAKLIKQK